VPPPAAPAPAAFTRYQKGVLALLAVLQFTTVLDFMILSPLNVIVMPALRIGSDQWGRVVASYAFSAAFFGIAAAGFADRFDRKKLLLVFYAGFIAGTLLCGLASSYRFLLFARIVTGMFAGVVGSVLFAITTDLFPLQMRGRVMGVLQTAFGASQILGVPVGLWLANRFGWNAAFLMIVVAGVFVIAVIALYLQPVDAHLAGQPDRHPLHHLLHTVTTPRYLQGFATTALLASGGFMIMPFASGFTVHNLGIDRLDLPKLYLIAGVFSVISGLVAGRLSDRIPKIAMFFIGCGITLPMVLIYTHRGPTPFFGVLLINVIMFFGIISRIASSTALMSAVPKAMDRGAYMAVSSSVQLLAGGVGSMVAGALIQTPQEGPVVHFERVGYVVAGTTVVTMVMMYFIHLYVRDLLAQGGGIPREGVRPVAAPAEASALPEAH
jgi:predicted MFS family arabinose efflux permease